MKRKYKYIPPIKNQSWSKQVVYLSKICYGGGLFEEYRLEVLRTPRSKAILKRYGIAETTNEKGEPIWRHIANEN